MRHYLIGGVRVPRQVRTDADADLVESVLQDDIPTNVAEELRNALGQFRTPAKAAPKEPALPPIDHDELEGSEE